MTGAVVGITSLKVSQVGVEGMGYAININEATPILNTLITSGSVVRPYLGVSVYTVDQEVAAFYNLKVDKGVLVTDVASGSPADLAGIRPGDVITAIDGKEQTDDAALLDYINSLQVGQKIEITFYRGNIQNKVTVTMAQTPRS
jgi:serine protease Do